MNLQCANCYRTSDAYLCASCGDLLAKELRTVGWVSDELDVTLSRQDRIGAQQGGHKPGKEVERPLPLHLGASEAAWELHNVLGCTARDLAEQRGFPLDCVDTSPSIAAWLVRHVDAIRHDPGGGQTYDELTDAITAARRIVDAPAARQYLLVCGAQTMHGPCPEHLYGRKGRKWATCTACQTTHDADERKERMLEMARGTLGTPAELARVLPEFFDKPLDRKRIGWLIRAERLVPRPSADGMARYVLGEIVDAHMKRVAA